jgi:hypothetical protein
MNSGNSWNLLVFREAARSLPSSGLLAALRRRINQATAAHANSQTIINALVSAGELESALADAGAPGEAILRAISDSLADRLMASECANCQTLPALPDTIDPPYLKISPQEGFAYYALHPADFAELINQVPLHRSMAVIGIRSIGATLSATVTAALKAKGIAADRITVRPTGHPYDRRAEFIAGQLSWISAHRSRGSRFLIADEGPGISGSSFISAGEALVRAGISRESISFLCTRRVDAAKLKAPDAFRRWPQFHAVYLEQSRRLPEGSDIALAGGQWRGVLLPRQYEWPASWTSMERSKFLSADRCWFFKFEGLGHYGDAPRERGRLLSQAGFSQPPEENQHGFTRYRFVTGFPMAASDLTQSVLDRIARYCAFRATMSASAPAADLEMMVHHNLEQEFGDINLPLNMADLHASSPVVVDARMMPHDWIVRHDGRFLKVDATCHGDDHFFPGPTDIAWDLAGAIVEWRMDGPAEQYLVDQYRSFSGDHKLAKRLPAYLLAYSVFRMAYSHMAAASMEGGKEKSRLEREYRWYRQVAERQLAARSVPNRVAVGEA